MSPHLGGLEMISETYFRHLVKREIDICCFLKHGSLLHQRLSDHLDRVITDRHEGKFSLPLIRKLRASLVEKRITILHVHRSVDIWPASLAVRGLPTRLVYTSYNFLENTTKRDPFHRFIYDRCDLLTVFSEPQRNGFLKCLPVQKEKVRIIPHGIDLRRFDPAQVDITKVRRSLSVSAEHLVVGVVGRVMPSKGQWLLVELAPRLLQEYPLLRIVFVGADSKGEEDAYFRTLKNQVHERGLAGHVIFTGFRLDVPECLAAMDVFVLPSLAENFGTVLLEAMAMGRPCLGTRSGGTPDILDYGNAGMLFEPNSPNSLHHALIPLLRDANERAYWGSLARSRVEERYRIESVINQWIDCYREFSGD